MNQIIYELPNFITTDECDVLSEKIIAEHAPNFTNNGDFINKKWQDATLADKFWNKTGKYNNGVNIGLGANDLIMAGIYNPGNSFAIHTDTGLYFNMQTNIKTCYTLLIYLNDDFEGGNTIFYNTSDWNISRIIKPEKGKAIIFDINLWHSGDKILSGCKKWIGCELIDRFNI